MAKLIIIVVQIVLQIIINKGEKMPKQITKQEINKLDKHLQGLEDNWLSDEMNSAEIYQAEIDKDFDKEYDLIDTSTSKLPNSNYKDLRILRDFINKLKGEK